MGRGAALARSAEATLSCAAVPVCPETDALDLLRAFPSEHRFLWERAADGTVIAGVGMAASVAAGGPGRFAVLARRLNQLSAGGLPAGVVAVGGFAFDAYHTPSGAWREFPGAAWWVPRLALVRRNGVAELVAAEVGGLGAPEPAVAERLARARVLLARVRRPSACPPAVRYRVRGLGSPAAWRRAVAATLEDIAAGRLAKLVLARAALFEASAALDPLRVVTRLRRTHGDCTVFAVGRGTTTLVGATPERLARVAGTRLETAVLAGTAPRGASPAADRALAQALGTSPKERREHALVMDDVGARLETLCREVTIGAPRILPLESVQHLHSRVTARLRPRRGLLDAVAALHPTPAIAGAPRGAALAALRGRELFARGWYGGGVGWLDASGGEVAVVIRTALVRGTRATLFAGAGIVAGSDWQAELEETRLKMRPLLAALLEL